MTIKVKKMSKKPKSWKKGVKNRSEKHPTNFLSKKEL
jgi:hypothetical protein